MFRAIFCPSSGAWDWDFYSIRYPVVVVGRESVSGSVPRCRSPSTYPPQQQDTICCKTLSLTLLMMGNILPETCWADLIDQQIIVASSWFICITCVIWNLCVDFLYISQSKKNLARYCHKCIYIYIYIYIYICLYVKYSFFLSEFNQTWIFSSGFRKTLKYEMSWKSVLWEPSCPMLTDGETDVQTDVTKRIAAFGSFVQAPRSNWNNSV